jgi:hypothetical protein
MAGKTRNCRCQRAIKYRHPEARLIGARYDAAVRRCTDPNDPSYHNYGAVGIECRFSDRQSYVEYVLSNFPLQTYKGMDIDRCNTNGHYEPDNIRVVPRSENLRNMLKNKIFNYHGQNVVAADAYDLIRRDYPNFKLSPGTTAKLAAAGVPLEEILLRKSRKKRA